MIYGGSVGILEVCVQAVHWHHRRTTRTIDASAAKILDEFRQQVRAHWHVAAELLHWPLRSLGARVDSKRPGYVIFPVNGAEVHAPFFLTDMMPLGTDLGDMVSLGAELRLNAGSVICLSGSVCQVGQIRQVADIDFCEYVPSLDVACTARLSELAHEKTGLPTLLELRLGKDLSWRAPWTHTLRATEVTSSDILGALKKASFRQCVFVTQLGRFGILEATNMILDVDYSMPEAAPEASKSFAFQEVAVSGYAWSPRDLADPIRLGEYLRWLVMNADSQYEQSYVSPRSIIKAIRRLISACRLMMLGPEVDELLDLLRNEGALLGALHDRCALYEALASYKGVPLNAVRASLRDTIVAFRKELASGAAVAGRTSYRSMSPDEQARLEHFAAFARPIMARISGKVRALLQLPKGEGA